MSTLHVSRRCTRRRNALRRSNRGTRSRIGSLGLSQHNVLSSRRPELEDQCLPEIWAPRSITLPSLWIDPDSGAVHDVLDPIALAEGIYLTDGTSHL